MTAYRHSTRSAATENFSAPYFTTKGARQGTGLGLNIVQRLIKEAKGALRVQTRMGEGTTFTVYVRAARIGK